jgi:outer membrane lipopolysaccharide assembly protein LptE/RlpB
MKLQSLLLVIILTIFASAGLARAQSSNSPEKGKQVEPVPGSLDLKQKFHEYAKVLQQMLWQTEDQYIARHREFRDKLKGAKRELDKQLDTLMDQGTDWKKAKKEISDKTKAFEKDVRQQEKVQWEQFQLELLRFQQSREAELKDFATGIEQELLPYKKHPAYSQAHEDFRLFRDELRDEIRDFASRMKTLKDKTF